MSASNISVFIIDQLMTPPTTLTNEASNLDSAFNTYHRLNIRIIQNTTHGATSNTLAKRGRVWSSQTI
ncbi:hypothetical protein N7488_009612 [Penicillium malachiteum]|nr:hypothetical protein N7488_009612 [Penicillium malachiteum]